MVRQINQVQMNARQPNPTRTRRNTAPCPGCYRPAPRSDPHATRTVLPNDTLWPTALENACTSHFAAYPAFFARQSGKTAVVPTRGTHCTGTSLILRAESYTVLGEAVPNRCGHGARPMISPAHPSRFTPRVQKCRPSNLVIPSFQAIANGMLRLIPHGSC